MYFATKKSVVLQRLPSAGFVLLLFFWMTAITGCAHSGLKPDQKTIFGVLKQDKTLSGRVEVSGDLLVPQGVTLTLLPGTTLVFLPARNSHIEPRYLFPATELLVRGTLKAEGTAEHPISFTSPIQKPGAWAGIILDHSSDDIIRHAVVEYARGGIYVIGSHPKILDSTIRHTTYGIMIRKGAEPEIRNNHIENSRFGIFHDSNSHVTENGNHFKEIEKRAIFPEITKIE